MQVYRFLFDRINIFIYKKHLTFGQDFTRNLSLNFKKLQNNYKNQLMVEAFTQTPHMWC